MRLSVLSTAVALVAFATASPLKSVDSLLNLDFSEENIKQTLMTAMNQLPMDINIWAMNRTAGIAGVDMKFDIGDLASLGLVTAGPGSQNAKVDINVTVTGLSYDS